MSLDYSKIIGGHENLAVFCRKSDGATLKSVRVSLEEKEMRVFAIALTLTLFLYPEPAYRQAGG
jgi:hypothetical protein